jgi:hypothetical protein
LCTHVGSLHLQVGLTTCSFHFDTQDGGRPCEAAFLSSPAAHHASLPYVTVLCSYVLLSHCRLHHHSTDFAFEDLVMSTVDDTLTLPWPKSALSRCTYRKGISQRTECLPSWDATISTCVSPASPTWLFTNPSIGQTMPLYMHTALLIIRNMGVDVFSYLGRRAGRQLGFSH